MLFVNQAHNAVLILGRDFLPMACDLTDTLGSGRLFCFYYLGQECLRKKNEEKKLIGGLEIPSYCRLFLSHKYLSCSINFHPVIRGQPFYCQTISLCKPFHLCGGCRSLQVLSPRCTFLDSIFAFTHEEINVKGGEQSEGTREFRGMGRLEG
jgi:hypothetical protein